MLTAVHHPQPHVWRAAPAGQPHHRLLLLHDRGLLQRNAHPCVCCCWGVEFGCQRWALSSIHTHRLPGNIGDSDCGNLYDLDDGDGDEDDQDD